MLQPGATWRVMPAPKLTVPALVVPPPPEEVGVSEPAVVAGTVPPVVAGEVFGVVVAGVGEVVVVEPIGVEPGVVVPGEHDDDAADSPPEQATVDDLCPKAKKMTRPPTITTTITIAAIAPWLNFP
jgi:hypothetical protein